MLEEMKSCNVKPNAVTDTALLPGLCDMGKVAEVPKVLREMVERYIAPKDNSIFMKLLTAQCKSSDLNAAADVKVEHSNTGRTFWCVNCELLQA
ncbi:hypothetical protein AB3S75_017137 [Citrus x aurantiifolia]